MTKKRLDFLKLVQEGLNGQNIGLYNGLDKLNKYLYKTQKATYYAIGGMPGCLAGDTIVHVAHRADTNSGGRPYRIDELYYKFNNLRKPRLSSVKRSGHAWDKSISARTVSFNADTGLLQSNTIIGVVKSGVKDTYTITTASGKTIRATADHKFLTLLPNEYKSLSELKPKDVVFVRTSAKKHIARINRPSREYLIRKMSYYPSAKIKMVDRYTFHRIALSRLNYDANFNRLTVDAFLQEVMYNPNHGLNFSDMNMHIHHKDENQYNNHWSNLELLDPVEHNKMHSIKNKAQKHFGNFIVIADEIVSIEYFGPDMTYDIQMQTPHHNFVANGIVTHNSGKSAFVDDNFVLSPYLYYKNQGLPLNVKWFYYSFEISEEAKRAKWTAYKIWNDHRVLIDPAILMGKDEKIKLTTQQHDLVKSVDASIEELMYDYMDFIQDPLNPTGILHDVEKYMLTKGKLEKEEYTKEDGTKGYRVVRYVADDPDHHVIVIVDHVALTKEERGYNTKQTIDKLSEYMRYLRNIYKITPVLVCQFNKGLSGVERQKLAKSNHQDLEPILEDFKDTGNIGQDCNVAVGLFNPAKYNIQTYADYDITQMPGSFRSAHLMKNRDGQEYFVAGMHFSGGIGRLRELPAADLFAAGIMDYKNYQ
jgi:hypothetical protein